MDLVQDSLTLEAATSAVQASYDDAVRADQHRIPAEGEAVIHSLATGGAVPERSRGEAELAELRSVLFLSSVPCLHLELYHL